MLLKMLLGRVDIHVHVHVHVGEHLHRDLRSLEPRIDETVVVHVTLVQRLLLHTIDVRKVAIITHNHIGSSTNGHIWCK